MESIKILDGVNVCTENEKVFCEGPTDIWKLFKWDVENDPNAKECATIITRELLTWGEIDLSAMNKGKKLLLKVVPVGGAK